MAEPGEESVRAAWIAVEKKYLRIWKAVERVERLQTEYEELIEALHAAQVAADMPLGRPAHQHFRISPSTVEAEAEAQRQALDAISRALFNPTPIRPRLRAMHSKKPAHQDADGADFGGAGPPLGDD